MAESSAFPWLQYLPDDAAREFFEELSNTIGDAQTNHAPGVQIPAEHYVRHLDPMIHAWKATAEVHADPELYAFLTQNFDMADFGPVPSPREEMEQKVLQGLRRTHLSTPQIGPAVQAVMNALFPPEKDTAEAFAWPRAEDQPSHAVETSDHGLDGFSSCGGGCCEPVEKGKRMDAKDHPRLPEQREGDHDHDDA